MDGLQSLAANARSLFFQISHSSTSVVHASSWCEVFLRWDRSALKDMHSMHSDFRRNVRPIRGRRVVGLPSE
jgi:hypothetical protein